MDYTPLYGLLILVAVAAGIFTASRLYARHRERRWAAAHRAQKARNAATWAARK